MLEPILSSPVGSQSLTTIENAGNLFLLKDSLSNLYIQSGSKTPVGVTYGNSPIYENLFAGWQLLAAENINGQDQLLWKNTGSNSVSVWKLDSNANFQTSEGPFDRNSAQSLEKETLFQLDLNGDGFTGIEIQGNLKLVKDSLTNLYIQTGSNTPVSIQYGNSPIYENIFAGWQLLAVENISGQNQVLWKNTTCK